MTPRSCLNHALTLASCRPTVNRGYQRRIWLFVGAAALASVSYIATLDAQGTRGRPAAKTPAARFRTTLTPDQMNGKQVVVQTGMGTFVIQLLPAAAPNHVGYVIDRARAGAYDGTTFHRAIKYGIIQGGDPLSKEPAHKAKYGTGGLGILDAEISGETMTRGAVAAVVQPGKPNSAGSQFFIAVTDQPALEGQYTIFGRVIEGMEVVQKISEAATDANGRVTDRIEMTHVTIRDAPPVEPEPFVTESVEDLARHRAVLETTMGPITLAFLPDKAPGHVRNFLRLASLGAYDGTAFHRVVRGFVLQGGMLNTRTDAVPQRVQQYVRMLAPEFNDTPHVKGTLSMARTDDPGSASTSFFICTGPAPSLDGKYTVFGHVVEGMGVVEAIDAVPVDGETPTQRLGVTKVTVRTE